VFDRGDLHGDTPNRKDAPADQVGQERLQVNRNTAPLVEQQPQPGGLQPGDHRLHSPAERAEEHAVLLRPGSSFTAGAGARVPAPLRRRHTAPGVQHDFTGHLGLGLPDDLDLGRRGHQGVQATEESLVVGELPVGRLGEQMVVNGFERIHQQLCAALCGAQRGVGVQAAG
jgi:hypothetical protein